MSVAKVIEISASSKTSFEDAINQGIARACDSVNHVRGAWIKEQKVTVDGGKISEYRVNMQVTFVVEDK
ncbi:MAG: dodecin family protein [Brachymonas sp.]|nr:dodecin family protein [Brachymonas sp.]